MTQPVFEALCGPLGFINEQCNVALSIRPCNSGDMTLEKQSIAFVLINRNDDVANIKKTFFAQNSNP